MNSKKNLDQKGRPIKVSPIPSTSKADIEEAKKIDSTISKPDDDLPVQLNLLKSEIRGLKKENEFYKNSIKRLDRLVDKLEQLQIENEIQITNLPTVHNQEDMKKDVLELASIFGVHLKAESITKIYSKSVQKRPGSVIIRLSSVEMKEKLIRECKKNRPTDKNSGKAIFMNSHFTPHNDILFRACRKLKREKKINGISVRNGVIFVYDLQNNRRYADEFVFNKSLKN